MTIQACVLVFSWPQNGPVSVLGTKGSKGLELPGGAVEESEHPRVTALRKFEEVTGCKYAVGRLRKPLPAHRADNWVLTHGFKYEIEGLIGKLRSSPEGEPGWFSLTDMVRSPNSRSPTYNLWAFKQCLGEEALRTVGFTEKELEPDNE